jgi:inosose dehydratase
MMLNAKVAVNPLPWVLTPNGFELSRSTVTAAVTGIAKAGFTAMHADVPEGMDVTQYRDLLSDHGVRPAPGYFSGDFTTSADGVPALVEAARRHAGIQAELGLAEVFLASHLSPARVGTPAIGEGFDTAQLAMLVERIAAVAEAITAQGVTPCFHPHVGTWIETEQEVRALLDSVDASVLSFGPDTGHLFWAGMDPAAMINDYASRVRAIHIKDVHQAAKVSAREEGDDYFAATVTRHVWTEPGRGDVDFEAVFAALPSTYDGWFVVEVDVPDLPTKEESTAEAARWILAQPERSQ